MDLSVRGPWGLASIELKPGAVARKKRPFRMPPERESALRTLLDKFESNGWIEPSTSDWSAQAFLVPKPADKSGVKKWRLVVDYRYLNVHTRDDPFPLPLIENLVQRQLFNRLWSVFDLQDGFHQMHLAEESRYLTAFQTPWGSFQWTVLPMGVKNGPSMFQRLISWCIQPVPCALAYLDDVITGTPQGTPPSQEFLASTGIPTKRLEKMDDLLLAHFRDTFNTLSAFRRCCLCTRGDKVKMFRTVIKFCGQILEGGRRRAAPSKLQAIREWKHPSITTMTKLKSFLGLAQHYSQFVPRYATLAAPLTEQLKGGLKRKVVWNTDSIAAFENLKKELLENVVLDIADPSKPYVLETDASDYAVGAVLSQYNENQELRPVAFFSRKLQGSPGKGQMGWSIREKETYAIVLVLLKFRSWLSCSSVHILVLTDHQSLKDWYNEDLNNMIGSVGRRGRWHEFFSQFNLEVVYVQGKHQVVADALSRWAYPAGLDTQDANFHGDQAALAYSALWDSLENAYDQFRPEDAPHQWARQVQHGGLPVHTLSELSSQTRGIILEMTGSVYLKKFLRVKTWKILQSWTTRCIPETDHVFRHPG